MRTKDYGNAALCGFHGGRTGEADSIFLKLNQVALGWDQMGDLSKIKPTRDGFKERLQAAYPDKKPGYYPMATGQLFRFVHEMKEGDLIVYPSKRDRHVHISLVRGYGFGRPGPRGDENPAEEHSGAGKGYLRPCIPPALHPGKSSRSLETGPIP